MRSDSDPFAQVSSDMIEHGTVGMTRALASVLPTKFRINAVRVIGVPDVGRGVSNGSSQYSSSAAPDDVARTVLFLLSGEAIGVNGQVIDVS